jgi:hypothetical protein
VLDARVLFLGDEASSKVARFHFSAPLFDLKSLRGKRDGQLLNLLLLLGYGRLELRHRAMFREIHRATSRSPLRSAPCQAFHLHRVQSG